MPAYLHNLLVAIDQLINTALGGWPDETLSSRAWRWHVAGIRSWPCMIIDAIFFWDRSDTMGHCECSWQSERTSRQLPPELRPAGK